MKFYAHSLDKRQQKGNWQPLSIHLQNVANLSDKLAQKFGFGTLGRIAGLLHDIGKYAPAFQSYIDEPSSSVTGPDHATAGAQVVMRAAADAGTSRADRIAAELAAFAVAGHHTGLPDRGSLNEPGTLAQRLAKLTEPLDPHWCAEVSFDLTGIFPLNALRLEQREAPFQLAFLGRMIFSALVDADYLDTEAFYASAEGRAVDRAWQQLPDILPALVSSFDAAMADRMARAAPTRVNTLRAEILSSVRAKAAMPKGVYTLNVPTGGGKTLASLAFALDHARAHRMERIVCAIPFTAIIDQTAKVFEDVLGSDIVLEHHSAIEEDCDSPREGRSKLRLAMENWAAPVVVTTNVQLFESLFASRSSRCRKLHALANAIIILDEAQTIPLPVLRPAVAALKELALNYGATIVLCTATQPALAAPTDGTNGFIGGFAPVPVALAPDPGRLHAALRRVTLEVRQAPLTDAELLAELATSAQGLVIVHTRGAALSLHRAAEAAGLAGLIHLSTRQIAIHRRAAIALIRQRLAEGLPCRVIATSLVEAGVDLDFPRVWRAEAGLDQIAQAAGRCNREGKRPLAESIVTVFRPAEGQAPPEIKDFAEAMRSVAGRHADLFSPDAIRDYFAEVYWRRGADGLDKHDVLASFRINGPELAFAYRTVGERFRLIENGMEPVIVPVDDAALETIRGVEGGWLPAGAAARNLQPYAVQVPPRARQRLIANGRARYVDAEHQFCVLADMTLYGPGTGLLWEDADYLAIESAIL